MVVALVLVLLAVLAAIQYQRQAQIAESDREKMKRALTMDTSRFAEDFNREIQGAYFNFQLDAAEWRTNGAFNERLETWTSKAEHPDLVRDFYFLPSGPGEPLKYDRTSRSFAPAELTPEIADLRSRLSDKKSVRMLYEDDFALAIPIHDTDKGIVFKRTESDTELPPVVEMPQKIGDLVVMLDPDVVKGKLLPELGNKYFTDGAYHISVSTTDASPIYSTGEITATPDTSATLLDLSPDRFMFFARRDPPPGVDGGVQTGVAMSHRVESRTMSRVESRENNANSMTIKMMTRDKTKPRTSIVTATKESSDGGWMLNVQHSAGSIDSYVNGVFRRNVAIGSGLFSLIGLAVLGIFFSAQRAKAFAQRQVDFVSSVSHEFRTPLAVIYSAGENLEDGVTKEDGQVSRYGSLIKAEGKKLSGMVEQILEFAGASSGRQKYNITDTDAAAIVRDAIAECQPLADADDFAIDVSITTPLPVKADAPAISRAVQNLILNAVKYSSGSRHVTVTASNGGGAVRIAVEDKGIGIAKSELKQIFEPFYRSKDVVDAQIHGNGLGLSLVKQIVEAHGGTVRTESEIGKGSKFTIELPQR
jgi:signal transduction histidine kinase